MEKSDTQYVIGVDCGGSHTLAVLADLEGKILAKASAESAHPRNIGIENTARNIALAIKKVLPKNGNILSVFIGLPAMEEEFKFKKEIIKKELFKHNEIAAIFHAKVIIGSDQLSGFRSGTDKKDGIMLNAGSGNAIHGWRGKKESKVDGWGYLTEMGSGFWIGQRGLQSVWKDLDDRKQKTLITSLVLKNFRARSKESLLGKIYTDNFLEAIVSVSVLVGEAGEKRDKVALEILREAASELALSSGAAIKKLNFQKEKFPLVLVGNVFNSNIILEEVKKRIKKIAPKVEFLLPKTEPVVGAVKLAVDILGK
jgi:N-acetylglucosamine kinase-like BadF-type ATPase